MRSKTFSAVLGFACAACIAPAAAMGAGTLDQQQTSSSAVLVITPTQSGAQTITAGLTGGLDQVDLLLSDGPTGPPSDVLNVEIRNVSAGAPGTTILASASVPGSAVTDTAVFVPITFATPAPVTAGTQYAIVASTTAAAPNNWEWSLQQSDAYAGGGSFFGSPPNGPWSACCTAWDQAFKTYVTTPPATAVATGQRAAALKKCKKKRKKLDWSKKRYKKCKKKANQLPV